MKFLMYACTACLISVLFISNIQAQNYSSSPITMEIHKVSSHCFDVTADTENTYDKITLYGNGGNGISRIETNIINEENTTTCIGQICFDDSTPINAYGAPRTIHCAVWKEGQIQHRDGCTVTIGPG